jgi:hypothetical protein
MTRRADVTRTNVHAWFVVNARNRASIALHERWHFDEVARGGRFPSTTFTGGVGILLRARRR